MCKNKKNGNIIRNLEKLTVEHKLLQTKSIILLLISEIVQRIIIMLNGLSQAFNPSYFKLQSIYRVSNKKYLELKAKFITKYIFQTHLDLLQA